jgi:cell division protein FtsZ
MSINLKAPELRELKPRIIVCGVGGAGGNAVNNMIVSGLSGVDFVVANTDAQALASSRAERIIQMGLQVTEGLGAGSRPEVGRAAAEEAIEEIRDHLAGAHMAFVTAGMGGGTGTGAAPIVARVARELGILTVGVVTKPFHFEGARRMRLAEGGIDELQKCVDTLIVIPNQNLFRVANEKTTFADAFAMADQVLYSGVACITDLMVKEGLINLDFADVRSIMSEMGKAMMGTGEATGEKRAVMAAEAAIANPLLDETSMKGAQGLLISITGGADLTLYEVDEAASRIRQEVDEEANIILGATFDAALDGVVRVSVVATGIDQTAIGRIEPLPQPDRAEIRWRSRLRAPRAAPSLVAVENVLETEEAPAEAVAPVDDDESEVHPAAPEPAAPGRDEPTDEEFMPAAPEPPEIRPPRMPQIDELPPLAQDQLRARHGEASLSVHPVEARRLSLLEKLAAFGISRREEEEASAPNPRAIAPALPAAAPPKPSASALHAEYGRPQPRLASPRPAQGNLDAHGRIAAPAAPMEEDQLEIPAFLRRHST